MSEDEKKNKANFYGVMLLIYAVWKQWNILLQRLDKVQKSWWISSHYLEYLQIYAWRLDIV